MTNILVDSSDIEAIKKIADYYPISGITTNPSILAKESSDLQKKMYEIKKFVNSHYEIHIQTTEKTAEKILSEAIKLHKFFGGKFFIKIPISKEGLKAVSLCKKEGIGVTVTSIFTSSQVFAAAKAGADYVAPYVNRMANIGMESIKVLADMQKILSSYNTKILAASFKNIEQFTDLLVIGVDTITVSADLLEQSIWHPYTDKSILDFEVDWDKTFGNLRVGDFI
ncbi:transaldolase family protein [Gemella sp. zg-1178]|uniref:transaldolase family protein n=1 Tax=Gemella sp. zg-1178 TaxID=2840372 RepID=UPI001C054149|nr:transaldolase family protein [Gemella sp. zg-1178]MBU0278229.1 transaldolase [Gemella sp. zg-1178]